MDSTAQLTKACHSTGCAEGSKNSTSLLCQTTESMVENKSSAVALETINQNINSGVTSVMPVIELGNNLVTHDMSNGNCNGLNRKGRKHCVTGKQTKVGDQEAKIFSRQERGSIDVYNSGPANASTYLSYEWPSVAPIHFPSGNSHLPPATDRLHLDVSHNWQSHYHQSYVRTVHHVRNSSIESGRTGIISRPLAMSLDWPPILRGVNGVAPSVTCNYDTGFISRRPSSFQQDLATQGIHCNAVSADDERVYSGEFFDFSDPTNTQEVCDEHDNHRMSEEELEVHGLSGVDYNQYFGGGVMYWNPSDYLGTSFSRPPSLSSDDSSWAWREADMSRAVDDMVAFSSSYSTNGLTSPSATSFCSPFDPLGSGTLSYVIPGSEVNSGKVPQSSSTATDLVGEENASVSLPNMSVDSETKAGDTLPYPILRPIIIPNMSRERSRSDFRRSHDRTSPCIPPNRQEQPRIKRPPSPVVLCVPRAPRLPPPSPVGDSRRHRVPTVRSGSSSPRHWGMKGWLHDGINFEEACIRMDGSEVVWPSWRSKNFSGHQLTQPLTGALLQDHLIAISQLTRDQEHVNIF